jgi:hypothetical protein
LGGAIENYFMDEKNRQEAPKDIHLDTPSEANREKHINFREAEETTNDSTDSDAIDEFAKERKEEWDRGIEQGKKAREENG